MVRFIDYRGTCYHKYLFQSLLSINHIMNCDSIFGDLAVASTKLLRQKSFDKGTSTLGRSFKFDDRNSTVLWHPISIIVFCN